MVRDRVAYIHLRKPENGEICSQATLPLGKTVRSWLFWKGCTKAGRLIGLCTPVPLTLTGHSGTPSCGSWESLVPGQPRALPPGSCGALGATYLYLETEDIGKVQWRGRWARLKTVEFYLQEVGAQLLLARLPAASRERIRFFRKFAGPLMRHCVSGRPSGPAR